MRSSIRAQWRGLLVAVVLLAVGGTVTIAALGGARRTSTAAERALAASAFADVSVDVSGIAPSQVEPLRSAPGVKQLSVYAFTAVRPVGSGMTPGIDLVGVLPLDDRALNLMDRPRLYAGRLPDPDRVDEAIVNQVMARRLRIRVGDTIALESYKQSEVMPLFESPDPPPPTGARGEVRVVGIGNDLTEIVDPDNTEMGTILLSHAWFERYGQPFATDEEYTADAGLFRIVMRARLEGGDAQAEAFIDRVYRAYDAEATTLFSEGRSEIFGSAETTLRVEALALALCALAAGIATAVAVGQALTRQQQLAAAPMVGVARALGIPRGDRVAALILPGLGTVALGLAAAVLGAVLASGLFPRGLGGRLEPSPGLDVDPLVLAGGSAVLGLVVILAALLGAVRSSRNLELGSGLVPRMRLPLGRPEVGVGVRMALHAGRGRTRVPARQTIIGAVVGVAGVVAALSFAASLDRLVDTPTLYGNEYDAHVVLQGADEADVAAVEPALTGDARIAGVTRRGSAEVAFRGERFSADFIERLKGVAGAVMLSGRGPVSPNEVAVNPQLIPGPGPAVGEVIEIGAGGEPMDVRVVGHLVGSAFSGVILTEEAGRRLGVEEYENYGYLLGWADGVDDAAMREELAQDFAEVYPVHASESIRNVRRVRAFPYALATLLAALAIAAVAHLLASQILRRSGDLAVLKAIGFSRRRVRGTVRWQALTVTGIAVVGGTVIGVVAGRGAWALVTSNLRVIFAPAVPPLPMVAVAVGAAIVTLLVAAVPAGLAARTPPAVVLRTE